MEEVPSFIRRKEITDFADGLDELVEGSGTDASEVGLEPGEGHPDGVEVGTVGGQEQKSTAMGLEPPGSAGSLVAPVCRQVVRNDP